MEEIQTRRSRVLCSMCEDQTDQIILQLGLSAKKIFITLYSDTKWYCFPISTYRKLGKRNGKCSSLTKDFKWLFVEQVFSSFYLTACVWTQTLYMHHLCSPPLTVFGTVLPWESIQAARILFFITWMFWIQLLIIF